MLIILTETELRRRVRIFKKTYKSLLFNQIIFKTSLSSQDYFGEAISSAIRNVFWSPKLSSQYNEFSITEQKYAKWIRTFSTLLRSGNVNTEDLARFGITSEFLDEIIIGKYSKSRECKSCKGSGIYRSLKTGLKHICMDCQQGIYIPSKY